VTQYWQILFVEQFKQFTSVHEFALITHAPEINTYPFAHVAQEVLTGQLIQLVIVHVAVAIVQDRRFGLKTKPALHVLHTEVVHVAQLG